MAGGHSNQPTATALKTILRLLSDQISAPTARLALVSDRGAHDETSMVGTRQGYLCLARSLIQLVLAADTGFAENSDPAVILETNEDNQAVWGNAVARSFYTLPIFEETSVVGAYVCESHVTVLEQIKSLVGDHCKGLENDPDFAAAFPDSQSKHTH